MVQIIRDSYINFMDNISGDELYSGLLNGLFTEKLPPVLTCEYFYNYCNSNNPIFSDEPHCYIHYSSVRNLNTPRAFGVPNPMAYKNLCKFLSEKWDDIKQHLRTQTTGHTHKISRIHIRKLEDTNLIFEMNHTGYNIDENPEHDLLVAAKYIVKADISNCFPNIYSHALPWALVGKSNAKRHRGRNLWYNKLDKYTMNVKHGETHGLLIGPHASNLLSEIILTVIDKALYDKGYKFIRNIDDYTCYVGSYEEAQLFLINLSEELRKYDLVLNHKKTKIETLPIGLIEQWVRKIHTFANFYHNIVFNFHETQAYLDLAIELMSKNTENSAILNYAIKVLSQKELSNNAKDYAIKTIFHLSIIYPYLIPLLDEYVFASYGVQANVISNISNKIFDEGNRTKNYEAVAYAIYYSLKYNFLINTLDVRKVISSNDCIYLLLSYLYYKKNNDTANLSVLRTHALSLSQNMDDFNEYWLFVYEFLSVADLTIANDWQQIKNSGVSFLKREFIY